MKKHVKLILPALAESKSELWRPIKYSLFPPLGLLTLASYFDEDKYNIEIVDQHVQKLTLDDRPDIVMIQTYITNAYRAYRIADHYRAKGSLVCLGGLHVTSLPEEGKEHCDVLFIGPTEATMPMFIRDYEAHRPTPVYQSSIWCLDNLPKLRRHYIKRNRYFVPNSLIVSRGCPHHCDFCYKDSFFGGGKSFYVQRVDRVLAEIDELPGRHLYFLDDHLLGDKRFAEMLFDGMAGMGRVFQGAATVQSILDESLLKKAAKAGLGSVFVGIESFSRESLASSNKLHNVDADVGRAMNLLHENSIMINGSFVFGLDGDDASVFERTVAWAVEHKLTTATFHIATPYPGTRYFKRLEAEGRILSKNWDDYTTRKVVFKPKHLSEAELEKGYEWAYRAFYSWRNIIRSSIGDQTLDHSLKHLAYMVGWKKIEPFWNFAINAHILRYSLPVLEWLITSKTLQRRSDEKTLHSRAVMKNHQENIISSHI